MSVNNSFVVGLIAGAIAVDYIELRIRTYKSQKSLKSAVFSSHKPLTKLREIKSEHTSKKSK